MIAQLSVKKFFYSALFCSFTIISCAPAAFQMVNDDIRNVKIFTWEASKVAYSAIAHQERVFHFVIKKEGYRNDSLIMHVVSNYNKTKKDYKKDAYLIWEDRHEPVIFSPIEEIDYLEQRNVFQTTTNTNTIVTVDQSTNTNQMSQTNHATSGILHTKTATSSSIDTDTRVTNEILNMVKSERGIYFSKSIMSSILDAAKWRKGLKLRVYDVENDFFDISFSLSDMFAIEDFIRSKKRR